MNNRDLEAAWSYHNGTKHTLWTMYNDPHYLDFDNQPLPFKIYSNLDPIPLPHDLYATKPGAESGAGSGAFSAISAGHAHPGDARPLDLETLASLFYHSAGITKRVVSGAGEMMFRAAACTGALYHIELYLVCGDLPGLTAGVYHYGAHDSSLRRLRDGDHRSTLVRATGNESTTAEAPAVVVSTGTFWRNAWKYRARTYRHCYWDSGTILANLLAICAALGVPARVVGGFVDESVNGLLGLDAQREVSLSLVPWGTARRAGRRPRHHRLPWKPYAYPGRRWTIRLSEPFTKLRPCPRKRKRHRGAHQRLWRRWPDPRASYFRSEFTVTTI